MLSGPEPAAGTGRGGVPDELLDEALERVLAAARAHLAAVRAGDGRIDDGAVWQAYVELNNATHAYDTLMLDGYGEVTPWDVDPITPDGPSGAATTGGTGGDAAPADPHPRVLSVRQRRDFRIPSTSALLAAAARARGEAHRADGAGDGPLESVGDAVLELLQAGDGSLSALDVPELEPCDGLVTVVEVDRPLDTSDFADADADGPFALADRDRLTGRLDEHPFLGPEQE